MRTISSKPWQIVFGLWGIQGIAALLWLLMIPTDTENPFAFGFSPARLALIGIAIVLVAISVLLLLWSRGATFRQSWLDLEKRFVFWDVIYVIAFSAAAAAIFFIIVSPLFKSNPVYSAYSLRLTPLVLWFGLSGLELAVLIAWHRYEKAQTIFSAFQPVWKKIIFLLVAFLLLGGFIVITKIGVPPGNNWSTPPVPFFEWQILFASVLIAGFAFFPQILSKKIDKWIPLGIYLLTFVLWISQPISTAYTATPPRAPNFEIYPFSDAQIYAESAQSALIGNGFLWPEVPARPFYVAFLTWLHLLGNQNYQAIIVLQTLVLAAFPAILYLLGRELGGRPLGVGLALLAAFRDMNSNAVVPFASNVTYSKLFLSELPTALLISLATLLGIRWLRSSNRPAWLPLLIGGLIGAAALIRLQSSILMVPIIIFAFGTISDRKQWLKGSALIIVSFALAISPWLVRNYLATGGLVLDNPLSQTMTMARRWSGSTGNELLPRLPGENDAQYSSRLTKMAIESFKQNPKPILNAATHHFVNNEIASLLAFPVRNKILSPSELLIPQHTFWELPLASSQIPLFVFYLLLFSIGVATAWHHHGWIGLLPLGLGLAYNLWTALFLTSGERFIVPLDWSIYLYELLGLIVLGGLILSFAQGARENIFAWIQRPSGTRTTMDEPPVLLHRRFLLSLITVFILGAFLPVTESIFPQKYPPRSELEIIQLVGVPVEEGETALYGRAIYPRYYDEGEGEPATDKLGYGAAKEARLVFFLIGPQNSLVIFELEKEPSFFPHTADVYMIGTQTENYFSPRVIKVMKDSQTELYTIR